MIIFILVYPKICLAFFELSCQRDARMHVYLLAHTHTHTHKRVDILESYLTSLRCLHVSAFVCVCFALQFTYLVKFLLPGAEFLCATLFALFSRWFIVSLPYFYIYSFLWRLQLFHVHKFWFHCIKIYKLEWNFYNITASSINGWYARKTFMFYVTYMT